MWKTVKGWSPLAGMILLFVLSVSLIGWDFATVKNHMAALFLTIGSAIMAVILSCIIRSIVSIARNLA